MRLTDLPASPVVLTPTLPSTRITRRATLGGMALGVAGALLAGRAGASRASTSFCDRDADTPGLVGDDAWQGPAFGLQVEWEPVRWSLAERSNRWVTRSIGREDKPVDCGYRQGASDRLMLVNGMWESAVFMVESYERGMWTLESMAEAMEHPGWVQNLRVAEGSLLLLADGAGEHLAALGADAGRPGHTVYWQATFSEDDESVIHQLTLHMWETGADYALHDIEGITIAGIDPFAVFDLDTLQQAIIASQS